MFVDKRKILLDNIGTGTTIDIALGSDFFPVDNSELIENKFVKDEIEKSINPIVDYKKIIFKPSRINGEGQWELIDKFRIDLNFYTPDSIASGSPQHRGTGAEPGMYSDINFVFDDVFCRTSRFINSFIITPIAVRISYCLSQTFILKSVIYKKMNMDLLYQ